MILEINNLTKKIGNKTILKDITFDINENEIVGFIGPNGAGKSTTLKCLAGLYYPTSGTIKINGYDIVNQRIAALKQIGISIENPALYPDLSGYDHFKLIARWHGLNDTRIKEMVAYSGIDDVFLKQKVSNYSLGMKQRMILSLVMMPKPKLLVLDEPSNGLDPEAVFTLRKKLIEIRQDGSSILFSSHQLSEMEKIADRVIFIKNGKIVDNLFMDQLKNIDLRYDMNLESAKQAIASCASIEGMQIHKVDEHEVKVSVQSPEIFAQMLQTLSKQNNKIHNIQQNQMNLEDYYKLLYKGEAYEELN